MACLIIVREIKEMQLKYEPTIIAAAYISTL